MSKLTALTTLAVFAIAGTATAQIAKLVGVGVDRTLNPALDNVVAGDSVEDDSAGVCLRHIYRCKTGRK